MTELDRSSSSAVRDRTPAWEYASAPGSREIEHLRDRYGLFIGGEFVEPRSARWFETISASTEGALAVVAEAGPEDVDLADPFSDEAQSPTRSPR